MLFNTTVAVAVSIVFSGCNSGYPAVDAQGMYESLEKGLGKSSTNVVKTDITESFKLEDFPLLQEVCVNKFTKHENYQYEGTMMRSRLVKFGYNMPVSDASMIYRHELATCSSFYPAKEGEIQEAVYVKYLATIDTKFSDMMPAIKAVEGGIDGLLQHSGFHMSLDVPSNKWNEVDSRAYTEETKEVQYLKMDPIEMVAILKYDAEKYKDLLAFEFVRLNVTMKNGAIQIENVDIATIQNGMF